MMSTDTGASEWTTGLTFAVTASIIGAGSKLLIRKSYIMSTNDTDPAFASDNEVMGDAETYDETSHGKSCDGGPHLKSEHPKIPESIDTLRDDIPRGRVRPQRRRRPVDIKAGLVRGFGVLGMTVLNPACNVYALKFASPSVLAPFGGLTLVWIVLWSERAIGERPLPVQSFCACLVILGEILIAIAGDHTNVDTLRMEDVRRQYREPAFLAYASGMLMWIALLAFLIRYGDYGRRRFALGVIGGSVTGVQNFIKDSLAVLHGIEGDDYPAGLFVLSGFAGLFPFIGLLLLMECMKRFDATYSAAMFIGAHVTSASVMSAVHYHTFDHLGGTWNRIFYLAGLLILLSGIAVLATRFGSKEKEENQGEKMKLYSESSHYGAVKIPLTFNDNMQGP